MTVHREGFKILGFTFGLILVVNFSTYFVFNSPAQVLTWTIPVSVGLFLFVLNFFRNPKRDGYLNGHAVIAPADGKIVVVEEVEEPEVIGGKALMVSIFMNVFNVHINWFPVNGKVKRSIHHKGRYMSAWLPKASTENERTTVALELENGQTIVVRQIAGAVARRIVCYAKEGDAARQGNELGFIKFGSRVDIYLPIGSRVDVTLGQKVKGKQTIIGWLE